MLSLRETERERLRAIVDVDHAALESLHDPHFLLCTPSGVVWDRAAYLGGLADGSIRYSRFEPRTEVECVESHGVGAVRYLSTIDISVKGSPEGHLECWHLDVYVRGEDGTWRCRWSQATDTIIDSA